MALLLLVLSGCINQNKKAEMCETEWLAATDAEIDEFTSRIASADAVVIGKVVEVEKSLGMWSGIIEATQEVHYQRMGYMGTRQKGVKRKFTLSHPIHRSYPTVAQSPNLRESLFFPGAELILLYEGTPAMSGYEGSYSISGYGVLPCTPATIMAVEKEL